MKRLAAVAIGVATCHSCSPGDGPVNRNATPTAGAPATSPAQPELPAPALAPAHEASDVAGSYLAGCSVETGISYVKDPELSQEIAACLIQDDQKNIASVSDVKVDLVVGEEYVTPALVPRDADSPWQVGFLLDPRTFGRTTSVKLRFIDQRGIAGTASTSEFFLHWEMDPAFGTLAGNSPTLSPALPQPAPNNFPTSPSTGAGPGDPPVSGPKPPLSPQPPKNGDEVLHTIFVTDAVFPGDLSATAADQHCDDAGEKILPGVVYKAVLSTEAQDARDHVSIFGSVNNRAGELVASAEDFFALKWQNPVKWTETAADVRTTVVKDSNPPFFETRVWTGTGVGGVHEQKGSCSDFTSAMRDDFGTTWSASLTSTAEQPVMLTYTKSCARRARLLCISQGFQ